MIREMLARPKQQDAMPQHLKTAIKIAIPLTLALVTATAWGFMVDLSTKINNTFAAEDRIAIEEEYEPPEVLEPGAYVPKRVWITNHGDIDCYVRALCTFSNDDVRAFATLDQELQDWSEPDEDGWRYYALPLAPDTSTTNLCNGVAISTDMSATAAIPFDVLVLAESVQASGYDDAATAFASIKGQASCDMPDEEGVDA